MSLSDMAEHSLPLPAASSASSSSSSTGSSSRVSLTIPTSLLILPSTAALIGLSIGIVRGGNKARLRFLAENAHRQPKTIQGWYFYTKTRNYRVFFASAKTGARYALGLGGATAAYVLTDESVGWARESIFGPSGEVGAGKKIPRSHLFSQNDQYDEREPFRRVGWREGQVMWEDGAVAGSLLGAVVGTAYRLPRPLFIRSLLMGAILGGTTSALQIAQAHVGKLREEREQAAKRTSASDSPSTQGPVDAGAAAALITEESAPVLESQSRLGQEGLASSSAIAGAVDQVPLDGAVDPSEQSWWSRLRSSIGI